MSVLFVRRNIASFSSISAASAAQDPPPGRGEEEEKEGKGRNFTFDMGKLLISFPRGMERKKKVGKSLSLQGRLLLLRRKRRKDLLSLRVVVTPLTTPLFPLLLFRLSN